MKFTISLMLLALFIQYSSPLECYFDVEEKPERNSTEQVHCVCGSYCSSMYYKFEKVYLRDCGCLVDENGTTLHICLKEGRNEFNGSDVDCCSRNLCNGEAIIVETAQSYSQHLSILILFSFLQKVFLYD